MRCYFCRSISSWWIKNLRKERQIWRKINLRDCIVNLLNTMAFNCDLCDASYPVRKSLLRHIRLKHGDAKQFSCKQCAYSTTMKHHLDQHVRSIHQGIKEPCETCGRNFSKKSNLNKHLRKFHPELVQERKGVKRKASNPLPQPTKKD